MRFGLAKKKSSIETHIQQEIVLVHNTLAVFRTHDSLLKDQGILNGNVTAGRTQQKNPSSKQYAENRTIIIKSSDKL